MIERSDEIWADTTDGDLLRHLFGFYPTLHDASFTEFVWDLERRILTGFVDYDDIRDDGQSVSAQIALIWGGVKKASLPLEDLTIATFEFRLKGDLIETWWTGSDSQFSVAAERFDAEIRRDRAKDPPLRWRIT